MTKKYPDINPNPNFAKIEENILKFWDEEKIFEKSVEQRPAKINGKNNEFIFYDGPPFANGLPHYGHLLTGFVKDIFARYQTQLGKRVERRFGWDCHGLPAEMGSEKELNISGRMAIKEYGIDKFNEHCRTSVMKYAGEWEYYVNRQARWVDFENGYKTMDLSYMESVIHAFKTIYDKGLMYEAMRVMPYSWAAETPLSNFETRMDDSYRDRTDKAVTVAFELEEVPDFVASEYPDVKVCKVLAWTTTPWTLPSNLALAVSEEMEYTFYLQDNTAFVVGKSSCGNYSPLVGESKSVEQILVGGNLHGETPPPQPSPLKGEGVTPVLPSKEECNFFNGKDLVGLKYKPLFPYFKDTPNAFQILAGDFIEEGSGTGVVHMAPGFGEDDQTVCEDAGIELVCPVDNAGKFTDEVSDYAGINVLEANKQIIKDLEAQGSLIDVDHNYKHSYPHCWRTDEPLIYKAVPSWYVEVTKFRDKMVELNQEINWVPSNIKDGLFGKWIENARDWSISRNRFWGCPVPVWKSDNPDNKEIYVFGSIAELEEFFGKEVKDLHRPYIDELTKPDPLNPKYTIRRVEDVLDCWFESGSMPYGQVHYPFDNKEWFDGDETTEGHFPADFIVEYTGQTRGWFYTLMVLGTVLFGKPPFKNCLCHGNVLDATGKKLSKRHRNYPDPKELFAEYGADALRWFMVSSPIMRGQELHIDKEGKFIRDVIRLYIKPIWNAYNFFTLYANSDEIEAERVALGVEPPPQPSPLKGEGVTAEVDLENTFDRYILIKCKHTVDTIKKALDAYDTPTAYQAISDFFEVLNNWYIRRNKARFWKTQKDDDKQQAYNTLYNVLVTMCEASASLLPLVTEEIYKGLTGGESVHLTDFPDKAFDFLGDDDYACNVKERNGIFRLETTNKKLIKQMDSVRDICNAVLSIRNKANIRTRQTLNNLVVYGTIGGLGGAGIIMDEVNVKNIKFKEKYSDVAEKKLQINFPVVGKRIPDKIKTLIPLAKQGKWELVTSPSPLEGEGRGGGSEDALNLENTPSLTLPPQGGGDTPLKVSIGGEILQPDEYKILLEPKKEYANCSAPLSTNDALVVLDLTITPELELEGIARDIVRMIQQARKDADLNVADKIDIAIATEDEKIQSAINNYNGYITEQTLGSSLIISDTKDKKHQFENSLGDFTINIGFTVS